MSHLYRVNIASGCPDKNSKVSGVIATRNYIACIVVAILAVNLLTACEDTFDKVQKSAEFGIERQDIANYRVVVKAPDEQAISVVRKTPATDEEVLIATNKGGSFYDENPVSGETYLYIVGTTAADGEFQASYSYTLRIPLDIISSNTKELPARYFQQKARENGEFEAEVETMVLDRGFPFFTNGFHGQLLVKNLFTSEGELVTFPEGSKAEPGIPGASGGPILLTVLNGDGDFKVIMRGQNGGDGITPPPWTDDDRGPSGKDGDPGIEQVFYDPMSAAGDYTKCTSQPTDGSPGGKGKKGKPGQNGLNGGDSGELHIEFGPQAKLAYAVEKYPGVGGLGAPGTSGGPGGFGGKAGEIKSRSSKLEPFATSESERTNFFCKKAKNGPLGPIGDPGDHGVQGDPGKITKSCAKNIGEPTEACE